MKTKLKVEVNSIKLTQKEIDNEVAQHFNQFNKEMLRTLNERALDRAFQLDMSRT
ncbi:MAG: hypothetical protein KC484_05760 [Colwelliaceae bacterium]|jgi:hypothetical protein|nr:hypothetical protein [Colwelliaceae bacterium]